MAVEASILEALRSHLVAFAKPREILVAFTNINFTPPSGKTYLRESFIPNATNRLYLRSDEPHRFFGVYQVDVIAGSNSGVTAPLILAGQIADHFAVDMALASDGITTRISKRPDVIGLMVEPDRAIAPVSIEWETLA
jgi:hypothetical protein